MKTLSWSLSLLHGSLLVGISAFVSHSPPLSLLFAASRATSSSLFAEQHVAIVGGGPSGLLLAHRLLTQGKKVSIIESRSDPRLNVIEGRAYALGVGRRGRTAIRSVDEALWDKVKGRGYESERFTLYLFGIPIRLRDGGGSEPSVLMYQSDLCAALLDELESRYKGDKLSVVFDTKVTTCDVNKMVISTSTQSALEGPFDFIVGCDGVNSIVRDSIAAAMPKFDCTKTVIPGDYKVCRLDQSPPKVDATSVCLILPKSGSTTAFVEPTADGCCILFAGRNKTDPVLYPTSVADATAALESAFPLLEGVDLRDVAEQLMQQTTSSTSSIRCNTYHYGNNVVLVGDAAHATGGVSGQGVNSALVDAMVLADCDLNVAQYSKRQVPEGLALYDLSFGPNPTGVLGLKYKFQSAMESLFRGKFGTQLPLQTLLTTTLEPFAEIRRQRDAFYETEFPSQEELDRQIDQLDSQ